MLNIVHRPTRHLSSQIQKNQAFGAKIAKIATTYLIFYQTSYLTLHYLYRPPTNPVTRVLQQPSAIKSSFPPIEPGSSKSAVPNSSRRALRRALFESTPQQPQAITQCSAIRTSQHSILTQKQAGFRQRRGTEDQLMHLSQKISDGFQPKPMKRTLCARLIDYSRAYDTVWILGRLWELSQKGIPTIYVRWIQAWLTNRINRVRFGKAYSSKKTFTNGVPQGSVISPHLFLMHIDDLAEQVETDVQLSLFADDVAIFCTEQSLHEAHRKVQTALDKIYEWSNKWKLAILISKCEAGFFTTHTKEHKWKPELTLGGEQIANKDSLVFLGVRFDKQLSFNAHAEEVSTKIKQRSNLLSCLARSDWGYEKATLRRNRKFNRGIRGTRMAPLAIKNRAGKNRESPTMRGTQHSRTPEDKPKGKYPPGSGPTSFDTRRKQIATIAFDMTNRYD